MLCPSSLWQGVGQKREWQDRLGWFPCRGLALSFVPGGCGDWIIEMWEKHGEAITALRWPSESTTRSLVQVSGCRWFLSRKSMQIFHLLHFVTLLYILLLQRFSFVQAPLANYSFEGPERFADIYRSPVALKGSQHIGIFHSVVILLPLCMLHQN